MAKRHYESVVIINAALEDDKVEEVIKKIEKTLEGGNAEITDVERWGRKRLAYPIKKAKTGYYVILRFKAEPSFIAKLDRFYRLEEKIVRFLTVLLDKDALKYIAEKEAQEAKEKEVSVTSNESSEAVNTEETTAETTSENSEEKTENVETASATEENTENATEAESKVTEEEN